MIYNYSANSIKKSILFILFFSLTTVFYSQVGVNTLTPGDGSILDVTATDKGMLIPRVNITNLSTIAPVTGGSTESLLVYNTNTSTGPGYFYWDGSNWVSLGFDDDDWELEGNAGTTPGTGAGQNYIGTSDNQNVIIAANGTAVATMNTNGQIEASGTGTNSRPSFSFTSDVNTGIYRSAADQLTVSTGGTDRLSVMSDGSIRAHNQGSLTTPLFAWQADPDTGFWRSSNDILNFAAGGREMIEMRENGSNSEIAFNDRSDDTSVRIETDDEANMLFVDGADDRIGIKTNNPQADVHIAGNTSALRIDALNSANSTFNNGVDNSVVYVDANGELVLQAAVDDFPVDASEADTFFSSPVALTSASGAVVAATAFTQNITLTRTTLVEVAFWTGVNIERFGGGLPTDGKPRLYGGYITDGAVDVVYNAGSWTNGILANDGYLSTGDVTTGIFTVGGNGFITLPAGNHTISLIIFAAGGEAVLDDGSGFPIPAEGFSVTFGANAFNRFQIVYHN